MVESVISRSSAHLRGLWDQQQAAYGIWTGLADTADRDFAGGFQLLGLARRCR